MKDPVRPVNSASDCSALLPGLRSQLDSEKPAEHRFEEREVRSYECAYVNGLWHLDFHHGSVRVLLDTGQWVYPILLGTPLTSAPTSK
jgi:hypothetical protein